MITRAVISPGHLVERTAPPQKDGIGLVVSRGYNSSYVNVFFPKTKTMTLISDDDLTLSPEGTTILITQ